MTGNDEPLPTPELDTGKVCSDKNKETLFKTGGNSTVLVKFAINECCSVSIIPLWVESSEEEILALVMLTTTEDGSVSVVRLWVVASEEEELAAFEEPVGLTRNWSFP